MSKIIFSRNPYTISYYKNGERHTINRRPPEKVHNIWPEDVVTLSSAHSANFRQGDEFEVAHINPRHPNVIQIKDGDGNTTFATAYDLEPKHVNAERDGENPQDLPINNRYLLWP